VYIPTSVLRWSLSNSSRLSIKTFFKGKLIIALECLKPPISSQYRSLTSSVQAKIACLAVLLVTPSTGSGPINSASAPALARASAPSFPSRPVCPGIQRHAVAGTQIV
jgi:hypothetical protein